MKNFLIHFLFTSLFFVLFSAAEEQVNEYSFAGNVAAGNDWLIHKGDSSPFLKPFTWVTSRAVSSTLFPFSTVVDMAILGTKQVHELPYILLNQSSDEHHAQFRRNEKAFKKSFLGLLAAPLGILYPDIVTHHFVPSQLKTFVITPYGKLYSAHAHIAEPKEITDIPLIIQEAKRSGKTVSIMGKLMSQGKQAISNEPWNVIINTSKLNHIEIDPQNKLAHVGAGATWGDLQREANQHGLAVRVMQASNIFSIGGSISANCHGWDHKAGSLRNTLVSLKIIDANGQISEITSQDPLFDYVVGGYGCFGIIVEATLSLTDNLPLLEKGVEINPRNYVNYFYHDILHNPDIEMHLYRLSLDPKHLFETGIAVNYQRIADKPTVSPLVDEPLKGGALNRIKIHNVRRLPWLRKTAWNHEKSEALAEKTSSRNEVMRPPIRAAFNNSKIDVEWLQEYFVKGEDLSDFLQFLARILKRNEVAVLNASVRYVKQDSKTKLSYSPSEDRFAVVLFFNQRLTTKEIQRTKNWVRQVIDFLVARGGTYYLPYQHFATLEQFQACYPNWKEAYTYKKLIDPAALFDNGFYTDYLSPVNQNSLFRPIFSRVNGQRRQVFDFLKNVFMQLNEPAFFSLIDRILENRNLNDEQIYEHLYKKIGEAKFNPIVGFKHTLDSLHALQQELGDQTASLLNYKTVNGYVEIGYPGRMVRPLKKRLEMKGPIYVINDKESFSDYVEAGFPRPYDIFVSLNDYEPIPEAEIPSSSVDLVCMYIGLHHAPKEKLTPFLDSINRILRPGGHFILMDHDAYNSSFVQFVDVVHSIFNVATGVEPEVNAKEIRNFHSLNYWIEMVEAHGLNFYHTNPLIRKGDSTLNSLIRFDKSKQTSDVSLESGLQRPLMHTYLTGPEWQNVRAAQRYATFVEKEPACRYPYFSEIAGFWNVYGKSWNAARREHSLSDVACSEYNLMNLFIGTTMTMEYGVKGIISIPFAMANWITGNNISKKTPADKERARSLREYGQMIENTPFYKYHYFNDIGSYWRRYIKESRSLGSAIKGIFVGTGMTIEYTLKGLLSAPMSLVYGSEALKEAETTHLILYDPDNAVEIFGDLDVVVLESREGIKHIEIPRYKRFTETMLRLADFEHLKCINIAGQRKIQVDVRYQNFEPMEEARVLYQIPVPTDKTSKYFALEVDVEQLLKLLHKLKSTDAEVLFIHDF